MKRLFLIFPAVIALTLFCSCEKQPTEAERNAEVERQVQQRLAAERQTAEQQHLAQTQADLDQRLKDVENRGTSTSPTTTVATSTLESEAEPERAEATRTGRAPRPRGELDNSTTGSYSTFYTRLEPQGSWLETSNYGYVWQPRVAQESRAWRPYTNGRWVYTDAGWTWISEEPFGWATYHYGRWTRLRNVGWVWVPGDEWAPAWVSWRKGGDYVGWAPLPPEARFEHGSGIHGWADNYYDIGPDQYAFVSTRDFGNERIDRSLVPSDRNVTMVDQTTNVTNITYNNTTVVNEGPNFEEIRSHSGRPIERLRLERQVTANFSNDPRTVVRGEIVEMPAPVIARAQSVDRPRNLKQNVLQAVVDHGWENVTDHQAAERVRVKMKGEATPPPNAPSRTFVKPPQAQAAATTTTSATPASPVATATPAASVATTVTATATAAVSPVATPPRRRLPAAAPPVVTPTATAATAATMTATPAISPSPVQSAPTAPSAPRTLPRASVAPAASAVPSATAESTTSAPPAQFDRNARQERKAERQQRREQSVAPEPSSTATMSPATSSTNSTPVGQATPASASTPDNAGSPSLSRKEQRKEQRRARRAGEPEETPTPSP